MGGAFPAEFSTVADFNFARDTTVPTLRAAGLAAAKGNVVAFLEDHCVCVPGWRDAIMAAHDLPVDAVGGRVDLAPGGRPLDWAVYFFTITRALHRRWFRASRIRCPVRTCHSRIRSWLDWERRCKMA